MCGIAGFITNNLQADETRSAVMHMMSAMEHRGPDSCGIIQDNSCTLGHKRLAVIDTSDAGSQPMHRDGVYLVYNGELYNFSEERKILEEEGVLFEGNSDTEVLLMSYIRYGERFLSRLRGIYSFALWDSKKQILLCARDPLGVKPFLYSVRPDGFIFASELKSMLASTFIPRDIDRNSLYTLLLRGAVPQPATMLKDVKFLLPGKVLKLKPGESPVISTFRPLQTGRFDLAGASWPEIIQLGKNVLIDVLEQQMVSDVPIGAFLSGGLDSSLLVALMAQRHDNVKTFSVGFEADLETQSEDETSDAALVADYLNIDHRRIIVTQKEVADDLCAIARGLDHPTVDGVNSWFVSKAAAQDVTVAVSGTGGDELFAGYPWFKSMQDYTSAHWYTRFKRNLSGENFASYFLKQHFIFDAASIETLCSGLYYNWCHPDPLPRADPLSRVTGMLLSGYTRDQLLADIDTASMFHGLEVRVPLLDEHLLDFALSLPKSAKIGGGDPRSAMGSYAYTGSKRLLMEIAGPLLNTDFMLRQKRGFSLPFDGWLRGVLKPQMNELLAPEIVNKRQFFSADAVLSIKNAFERKQLHWTRPWLLMMIELWAQEVLDA